MTPSRSLRETPYVRRVKGHKLPWRVRIVVRAGRSVVEKRCRIGESGRLCNLSIRWKLMLRALIHDASLVTLGDGEETAPPWTSE
jgi:hypothetical protein